MEFWGGFAAWAVGMLLTARAVYRGAAETALPGTEKDGAVALMCAAIWPITWLLVGLFWFITREPRRRRKEDSTCDS